MQHLRCASRRRLFTVESGRPLPPAALRSAWRRGWLLALPLAACTLTSEPFEPGLLGSAETESASIVPAPAEGPAAEAAGGADRPLGQREEAAGGGSSAPSSASSSEQGLAPAVPLEPSAGGDEPLAGAEQAGPARESVDAGAAAADAGRGVEEVEDEPGAVGPIPEEPAPEEPLPEEPCPGPTLESSCYVFVSQRVTWSDAEAACDGLGGHLASVESFEEDAFLGRWPAELGLSTGDGSGIWLGATDAQQDGFFRWSDDTPLSFSRWAPGQPDNGAGQDCIEKRNDGIGLWYDRRCTDPLPYVCERPR